MPSLRAGPAAFVLGVAMWAQLCLAPAVARSPLDAFSLTVSFVPLVALGGALVFASRDAARASTLGLAVFPCLVGLSAFVSGRSVVLRFDVPSRILAALTALAAGFAVAAWRRGLPPRVPVSIPHDERALSSVRSDAGRPALQRLAFAALATVAAAVAVLGPALLAAREPDSLSERLAGEALVRGRGALVSAVGTLLALAIVLHGGTQLLRASPQRPRTPSRAVAYALWALCALVMRRWLDQSP